VHNLPQPDTVNPAVLTATDPDGAADDDIYELFPTMDLAMFPAPAEESAVDDFAVLFLPALGHNTRRQSLRMRRGTSLWSFVARIGMSKTDACFMNENQILLLVQEDKLHMDHSDLEPKLIADDSPTNTRSALL
jgi:hypothetical protein